MSRSGGLLGVMHFAAVGGVGRGWRVRQERGEGGLGEERGKEGNGAVSIRFLDKACLALALDKPYPNTQRATLWLI